MPHGNYQGRYISQHGAAGTDHGTMAYSDPGADKDVCSNPRLILDNDRRGRLWEANLSMIVRAGA